MRAPAPGAPPSYPFDSMTLLTALTIESNEVCVTHAGPHANGLFSGWITHTDEKRRGPILTSEPLYATPEEARAAMQAIVDQIRAPGFIEEAMSIPPAA